MKNVIRDVVLVKRPLGVKSFSSRVAFIAHALLPGYRSTELIHQRMHELGISWPSEGEFPEAFKWFSFPVFYGGKRVLVDFWIIPRYGPEFDPKKNSKEVTFSWVEAAALKIVAEAKTEGVRELQIGWGALTKQATDHGSLFLKRQGSSLPEWVSTTHGDAGTAALVLEALKRSGVRPGFRVSIIGAYGVIGSLVARVLPTLKPSSIQLVGPPDRQGCSDRAEKLEQMRQQMLQQVQGTGIAISTSQDKTTACLEHESDVVIVSTIGAKFVSSEVPSGTLVLDLTTPSACSKADGWSESTSLVLTSGCGQVTDQSIIPSGFGWSGGKILRDVGAGGTDVLWGCTLETIARAVFSDNNHICGENIKKSDFFAAQRMFRQLNVSPQPPVSLGRQMSWGEVQRFVSQSNLFHSLATSEGFALSES